MADSTEERTTNPEKPSALECTIRSHSLDEAYSFYNLYSWELGFGIRYGKSRLNVHKKCMQEILCGCAVSILPW